MHEIQAMVSTANATWWLLLATSLGAIATFCAVLVALNQERWRRGAEKLERICFNKTATNAIAEAEEFCRRCLNEVKLMLSIYNAGHANSTVTQNVVSKNANDAWDLYSILKAYKQTIEYVVDRGAIDDKFILNCNENIERLIEKNVALDEISNKIV